MRGGGVGAFVVTSAKPSHAEAAPPDVGDLVLESDRVRLVLGGDAPQTRSGMGGYLRQERFGALLELGLAGVGSGDVLELRSVLYAKGSPVPLRMLGIDVSKAGERPVLAVEESSRDGRFELRTEYRLGPQQNFVELVTSVTNSSPDPASALQLGDRTRWRGAPAFAPRLGYVHAAARADIPWLGRTGSKLTHGLAFTAGTAHASFLFDEVGSAGHVTLGASADLLPGASLQYRRDAIVVEGGLGKLAEIAWRRQGRAVGYARGELRPAQTWATIEARHLDGRTVLSVLAAMDGRFELPLPPGEYRFVLRAPGGGDEQLATIPEGGGAVDLSLVPPLAGTLSYLLTNEQQQPMPVRVLVRGVPPTQDPELGPSAGAAGAKNILYSLEGAGVLALPRGRYEIIASRGPEYALVRQTLEVSAALGATLRAQLSRVVDTTGYIAGDFHVHAAPSSDADVSLTDRVLALAGEGIEFAAATDHNHVTDYADAIRSQGLGNRLGAVTGVEVTTLDWGHFNAFPYSPSLPIPPFENTSPGEMFAAVRARAPLAVLQVNHPRMPGVGYFQLGELDTKTGVAQNPGFSFAFDTLEVTNGFDLENPTVLETNLREWFELLNLGRRYTAVGNSDSHRLIYQWAGWPRTYVKVPDQQPGATAPEAVARALRSGHAVVSCGIFVLSNANGSAGPGDSVSGSRVSLEVSVRAPEWVDVSRVEIYANGNKVEERAWGSLTRPPVWNFAVDLSFAADTWLVVVARGENFMNDALPGKWIRPFGFTNPIFVDADEDGRFTPPGR